MTAPSIVGGRVTVWWVVIDRTEPAPPYGHLPPLAFGPYVSEDAACWAMEHATLIDDACGSTDNPYCVNDCQTVETYAEDSPTGSEVVLIDPADPDHTADSLCLGCGYFERDAESTICQQGQPHAFYRVT